MNINDDPNSHHLISSKESSSNFKNLLKFILECLLELFEPEFSTKSQTKCQIIIEVITNLISMIQLVSICWYPDMPISEWNSYSWLWNSLWIFNYDNLCEGFSIFIYCYIIEFSLVIYAFFTVILCIFLKYFGYKLPLIFIHTVKQLLFYFTSLLFIPFLIILLLVFKYSAFKNTQVQEYYDNDLSKFDYGIFGSVLSPFIFSVFIAMVFTNELLTADLRHSISDKNIRARSNSLWDLIWISFCIVQSLLYVFMDQSYLIYYLIILSVMGLYLFWCGIRFLHYYNSIEMSIKMCKVGSVCIIQLFFILGYAIDDAETLTILSIFVTPWFSAYIIYFIHKKNSGLKNRACNKLNQFTLEHTLRHFLINKSYDNKEEIVRIFCKYSNKKCFISDYLLVIWEVNFISYTIKDERLARVKLAKITSFPSSFEGIIQKQRVLKNFQDKKSQQLPEIDYLEYLTGLDKAKRLDEELCIILMDLWAEIAGKNSKIIKIRNFSDRVADLSDKLKSLYSSLANKNKYPEVFDLYGMLLINILGEPYEGNIMIQRKYGIKKIRSILRDHSKSVDYGENVGFILISTHADSFGAVAYMNEKAAAILKVSSVEIIDQTLMFLSQNPFH
ncbi:unnamed protein product [Blepharisma stoltei]|uniref:TmcB/TmcC TPR repeats domain-containing protein n=1 Tax=Blepharisma stoltei TaxID=1481888 RepID=A0AAU9JQN1_9CILI|nr:unnamed protein product [Blepharisma stoltei]